MRQSDRVRAFKNELRNYTYYLSRISTLENSIEYLYDRLGGVRGIDPSKEPTHSLPDKEMEYKIRDDITRLEAQKNLFQIKKDSIDEILSLMENESRDALKRVYIDGMRVDVVATSLNLSHNALHKRMIKAIERALY